MRLLDNMTFARMTRIILLATIAGWITWDIFAYVDPQLCNTISCVTMQWLRTYPSINFIAGVLVGHLAFAQTVTIDKDGKRTFSG